MSLAAASPPRPASRWRTTLAAVWARPSGAIGLSLVVFHVALALASPWIAPFDFKAISGGDILDPPSLAHWFGTDDVGRDILSRVIFGTRPALLFVVVVLSIAMAVGITTGLVAGYFQGTLLSTIVLRITDVFLAVPPLALALAVTVAFNPSLSTAMVAVSFTWWPWYTRLVYGETLRLRSELFVDAARAMGQKNRLILFRHILPNIVSPILVKATLDISFIILLGSSLSFLGIGAQEPTPDWGAMVAKGRVFMPDSWWVSSMPGLAIFVVVVGFNLLGDALRDALDVWR